MKTIGIEGWRGINHSFALVNQCQILEMLKRPGLRLFHRDLPFAMSHWNGKTHNPGFAPADWEQIAALQAPDDEPLDCIYRICSPFRIGLDAGSAGTSTHSRSPLISFMVTEMGLSSGSFEPGAAKSDVFTRDANLIVTPTQWSRDRLLEWGFAPEKVRVVTHGVNAQTFRPLSPDERTSQRRNLGFDAGHCILLNLGAAMWNKGLDVLLLAYAILRQTHKHLRLVLKDQQNLYGVGMDRVIKPLCQSHPQLFTAETLASISLITVNLSQEQLRALYGMADGYVSTYRAEGFNLPVLEALACGTPAVVTGKGATADFCNPDLAISLASNPGVLEDPANGRVSRYQEPNLDDAVQALARMATGSGITRGPAFDAARSALVKRLSWQRATDELLALARQACAGADAALAEAA